MEYRAVGNRCAVDIDSLRLPMSKEEILLILAEKNFRVLEVDIISIARSCIGISKYRRGAKPSEAPAIVDCSSFIKWLYAMRGIWLPRRAIQQREFGETVSSLDELVAGDVVFTSGWIDYYLNDPADGVGHVGIYTENKSVIHAANQKVNVIESPLGSFVDEKKFRGVRRYIPKIAEILTLETPPSREVETADDIRWIILQSCK